MDTVFMGAGRRASATGLAGGVAVPPSVLMDATAAIPQNEFLSGFLKKADRKILHA